MIAYLRGLCQAVEEDAIVVDVRGVGYLVYVSETERIAHRAGGDAELLVHTEVREDAIALYGFSTVPARDMFRALLSVPGVGPKAALSMLSALEPPELAAAIRDGRAGVLTQAKGIGKKTAETIVVKLRDRLPLSVVVPVGALGKAASKVAAPLAGDLQSALQNLGFRPQAVELAVAQVLSDQPAIGFDEALRAALAQLRRPN